jgi:Ankyrin repeats (3 copies)
MPKRVPNLNDPQTLDPKKSIETLTQERTQLLFTAVNNNNLEHVKRLLIPLPIKRKAPDTQRLTQIFIKADPNVKHRQTAKTLLHISIKQHNFEIAQVLLEQPNIEGDVQDKDGCTPLHEWAAFTGEDTHYLAVGEKLLQKAPKLLTLLDKEGGLH